MPLNPILLAESMTAAEVAASGGVLSAEALAKIREKNTIIANAIATMIVGATVTVQVVVAPAIPTAGVSPSGPTTGATIGPGTGTGTGIIS